MKKKHAQILGKQQSFYEAEVCVSERQLMKKQDSFKSRMMAAQVKVMSDKLKLKSKLRSLNIDLSTTKDELTEALSKKRRATSLTAKARKLASHRLEKWHIERERRRAAEDKVACLNKSAMQMNQIIEEYRMVIEQSHKSKCHLIKEWANVEAAAAHGGGRQWPPWVVQIICELCMVLEC